MVKLRSWCLCRDICELRSFVSFFRPRRIISNTLDPRLRGLDWLCLDHLLEGFLSPLGATDTIPPTPTDGGDPDLLLVQVDEEGNAAVKNVVGCSDLVQRWADRAKLRSRLEIMAGHLDPERKSFLDKLLRLRPDSPIPELHSSKIQITASGWITTEIARMSLMVTIIISEWRRSMMANNNRRTCTAAVTLEGWNSIRYVGPLVNPQTEPLFLCVREGNMIVAPDREPSKLVRWTASW